jgi:hypothetical protein
MAELSLQLGHTTFFVRVIASCLTWRNFAQSLNGYPVPESHDVRQFGYREL